jgi:hypothetical protein
MLDQDLGADQEQSNAARGLREPPKSSAQETSKKNTHRRHRERRHADCERRDDYVGIGNPAGHGLTDGREATRQEKILQGLDPAVPARSRIIERFESPSAFRRVIANCATGRHGARRG